MTDCSFRGIVLILRFPLPRLLYNWDIENLLVTGFGPFGTFGDNPSQWLAERLGAPFQILRVSFAEADSFIDRLVSNPPETLLLLGLHGKADKFHVELVAHNTIGSTPDVDEVLAGPGPLDPSGPSQFGTTLWRHPELLNETEEWKTSLSAGDYLCNYIYYRALQKLPNSRVGFLHVPKAEVVPLEKQLEVVGRILQLIEAGDPAFAR